VFADGAVYLAFYNLNKFYDVRKIIGHGNFI
jgi:hypothetical protein